MLTDEIMGRLVAKNVLPSTQVFGGDLPDPSLVPVAIAVVPYGGGPDDDVFGGRLCSNPGVQIQVRGGDYPAGEALAAAAKAALVTANEVIGGTRYESIAAVQQPFPFKRDSLGNVVFAFNVMCQREA